MDASAIVWRPSDAVRAQANWTALIRAARVADYAALETRAAAEPEWFWTTLIGWLGIRFTTPCARVLDLADGIAFPRWCEGATTNLAANALDAKSSIGLARPAVIGESEDGRVRRWSYAELAAETSRLAVGLTALGIGRGDVVGLHLPMVPEVVAALLACARIGAIGLPLFSGFGAEAVAQRLSLGGAVAVITADATLRRGVETPLKSVIDEAAPEVASLRHVIVLANTGMEVAMTAPRDVWWHALTAGRPAHVPALDLPAEHPLLIVYTSGTTGLPKGTVHTHLGLMVKLAQDARLCFDLKPEDRLLWMSDFGWFIGPIQIIGGLLAGACLVLAEGAPDRPEPGRVWRMVEQHRVSALGIGPTLARTLRRTAEAERTRHDLWSLRIALSSGEPWDEPTWLWVFRAVLGGRGPLINFSGGTEMSGIVSSNILFAQKPASFNGGIPGTGADIVDEAGNSVPPGVIGELVMRAPCIGTTRGLWQDRARYLDSYWRAIPGMWVQGDLASRDEDGFWFLHGRSDDTLKISGKRVGPAEIEAVLMASGELAEVAVIGLPDPVQGSALTVAAVPRDGAGDAGLAGRLAATVERGMGRSFRPRQIVFVADLPKTRSMKVMRRTIRAALTGENAGDLSSLVNPEALDGLRAAERRRP